MEKSKRWSNTRILGACGLAAAILGTSGGWLGGLMPRTGLVLVGTANAVMLAANLVLLLRRES